MISKLTLQVYLFLMISKTIVTWDWLVQFCLTNGIRLYSTVCQKLPRNVKRAKSFLLLILPSWQLHSSAQGLLQLFIRLRLHRFQTEFFNSLISTFVYICSHFCSKLILCISFSFLFWRIPSFEGQSCW